SRENTHARFTTPSRCAAALAAAPNWHPSDWPSVGAVCSYSRMAIVDREGVRGGKGVKRSVDRMMSDEQARQCDLLRDIFGNPFRPVSLNPSWLTPPVVALAEGIYADRAFDRLPILADAIQDAGCENADLLGHCRGPGPHARGCWAVDLVLGKE